MLVDLGQWPKTTAQLKVIGRGDVTLSQLQAESTTNLLLATHYLLSAGDRLLWQAESPQVFLAADKIPLANLAEPLHSKSPVFTRANFRDFSRSLCRSNLASATISEPPYTIKLSKLASCAQAESGKLSYRQQLRITNAD